MFCIRVFRICADSLSDISDESIANMGILRRDDDEFDERAERQKRISLYKAMVEKGIPLDDTDNEVYINMKT